MNDQRQHGAEPLARPAATDPEKQGLDHLPLAGYPILSARAATVRRVLMDRLAGSQKTVLLFANTNFVMQCRSLLPWLHSKEVLLLNEWDPLESTCRHASLSIL